MPTSVMEIKRHLTRSFVIILLLIISSCVDRGHEKIMVRQSLNRYLDAVSNNLGAESIKYIDSATINYYNSMLPVIIGADSITVEHLRFDQKLLVLMVRHTLPLSKVSQMTGATLFEYLVQTGQCEGKGLEKYYFDVTLTDKSKARVQLIDSNNHAGIFIVLNKEYNVWKINLPSITTQISKKVWKDLIKETGMTERELILAALKLSDDKEPDNSIWHPMK